ncbi:MAG TPA: alpha/beta hydrolase [Terriglobales bacterium]|nr:alpha/beta hydrolase [Terriglobales bacterium]
MPKVTARNLTFHYEQQGSGEPLVLIPHLAADHACYAFQLKDYAAHFTCICIDLRGTGESDDPAGDYSTETLADDVAGFMQAMGIQRAHICGLSLGGAVGLWLAAKYPEKVKSLAVHSCWPKTDLFIKTVLESWQTTARALASVSETLIRAMFPWCFTPELYVARPDYIQSLADFARSRPAQSVDSFLRQSNAVITHEVEDQLSQIAAPTQITFGRHDMVTSTRFADRLTGAIRNSELVVFEESSHAPMYESVEEFNERTLQFLRRQAGRPSAAGAA